MGETRKRRKTVKIGKRGARQFWPTVVSTVSTKWFLNLLVGLMIAGLVGLAVERVWTAVIRSDVFKVSIRCTPAPDWLDGRIIQRYVTQDKYLSQRHTIFESDLRQKVAERFEAVPWVKKVTRVGKVYPNVVEVSMEYRRPAAVVYNGRTSGRWYLADDEGVCLGQKNADDEAVRQSFAYELPEIYDAEPEERTLRAGDRWSDKAVAAGASVAAVLRPLLKKIAEMPGADPIVGISVENFEGHRGYDRAKPAIVLLTKNRIEIEWGNNSAHSAPDEPSAEEKLANLENVYKIAPDLKSYEGKAIRTVKLWIFRDKSVISVSE